MNPPPKAIKNSPDISCPPSTAKASAVEELLDPKIFYRANRQFIINIEAIQTVKPIENSKLIITLKEPNHKLVIDMSRLKSPEFKKWMDR